MKNNITNIYKTEMKYSKLSKKELIEMLQQKDKQLME